MRLLISFLCLFTLSVNGQIGDLDGSWQSIGPNNIPFADKYAYACGTGPVEFIRISESNPNFMFAGSLNGGLFYSENGGDEWMNAGSDYWSYSACPWADFHPTNELVWFGVMHSKGKNGKPGDIGKDGGVLRSFDKGVTWKNIAGVEVFGGDYVEIFGTRFHPEDSNKMFVMTSSGLFLTQNCTAEKVEWNKITEVDGWIYDLDFLNGRMYLSNFQFGNWHIFSMDQNKFSDVFSFEEFDELGGEKRHVTFEPLNDSLLVLVDYAKVNDQLYVLNPSKMELTKLGGAQMVNFGSGHTFKVNPHNTRYLLIGNATKVKYLDLTNMKTRTIGSEYHVDVEFVNFHPKDSLTIFIATHGGVWKSSDDGFNWEPKTNGLGVAEVMGMSVDPNNANRIAIGCFHDGSSYFSADRTNELEWEIINGGDGLLPLIHPNQYGIIYTSNQYEGGGIYMSQDTANEFKNVHTTHGLSTAGWETAYVLHPEMENTLFFNFRKRDGEEKNNIDIARTSDPLLKNSATIISNFKLSHQLESYKVYGLFNSDYYPNKLIAYVLDFVKDAEGKPITNHRLFINENVMDSANIVVNSWEEIEMPYNSWLGGVAFHPSKNNRIYLAYAGGKSEPESLFGDKGMVYALTYKEATKRVKKEYDISKNVPNSVGGKFNICFVGGTSYVLLATQTGVYLGDKRTLKGKGKWTPVGFGLPHCKPYGIQYNELENVITVGLMGRGVWQYYL